VSIHICSLRALRSIALSRPMQSTALTHLCNRRRMLLGLLFYAAAASALSTRVSPLQKVMQLLVELEVKVAKDGQREDIAFAQFSDFCKGSATDKQFEIKTAKAQIESLTATISKAEADASAGTSKTGELSGTISTNEADLKAASSVRKMEREEFSKVEADLMDVVDTLNRAINLLERKLKGSALLQARVDTRDLRGLTNALSAVVDAAALSIHDRKRLLALAQNHAGGGEGLASDGADEDAELGAPAADVYKAHSASIIDVLEDLREKAETQLAEARKQELSSQHNYEMLKQYLGDQIDADKKEFHASKASTASAMEAKAAAEGGLSITKKDLADSEAALEHLQGACVTAASDHEASVKSRQEELEALSTAKKAISEMTRGAEAVVYSNVTSLLQTRALSGRGSHLATRADLANFEVVHLVRQDSEVSRARATRVPNCCRNQVWGQRG